MFVLIDSFDLLNFAFYNNIVLMFQNKVITSATIFQLQYKQIMG